MPRRRIMPIATALFMIVTTFCLLLIAFFCLYRLH